MVQNIVHIMVQAMSETNVQGFVVKVLGLGRAAQLHGLGYFMQYWLEPLETV